jgi:nitrate/TMAO reductase-like tetraheme cytochrome c subunit
MLALILAATAALMLASPAAADDSPYVGASECKNCHEATHVAWAKSKHATAIMRLSPAEKSGGACIRCHVTGSPEQIAAEKDMPSHPGVQCESCHGGGRAHVEAAKAGDAAKVHLVKAPDEKSCATCHNDTGPHFKGFFYKAMAPMVHRTK